MIKNKRVFLQIIFIFTILILFGYCTREPKDFNKDFVTLKDYRYIPLVQAKLNNQYKYFILDTGASISVIDESEVKNMKVYYENANTITGYGGIIKTSKVLKNPNVELGGIKLTDKWLVQDINHIKTAVKNNTNITIAGIIGNNQLARYHLIIDLNKGRLYSPQRVEYKEDTTLLIH